MASDGGDSWTDRAFEVLHGAVVAQSQQGEVFLPIASVLSRIDAVVEVVIGASD